jgi:hypothetical protein
VLLAKDPVLPMVQKLDAREAGRIVSSGQFPGASGKAFPFANPHLAGLDATRSDLLRTQHERLFAATEVAMLNMAVGSTDSTAKRLLELVR